MPNYQAMAALAARRYGVPVQVFERQINKESHFDPRALSSAGAKGIAQFEPATAAAMGVNPMDPASALDGAARLDAENIKKYGSIARALSAYNSGRPDAYLDPKFAGGQTYNYVKDILGGKNIPVSGASTPPSTGVAPVAPGGTAGAQQALAALMLGQASQTASGNLDPSSILNLALMRQQLGAAQQVFGPASTPSGAIPNANMGRGSKAGGFLPGSAMYKSGRLDQGHDFQTSPGGAIIAPGDGVVQRVASDPHGFGPAYPIVHFTSGPYAGHDIYIGHTLTQLKPGQRFSSGQVISHTGTVPIGNAGVPGWAEIGFASNGLPGGFGQTAPF